MKKIIAVIGLIILMSVAITSWSQTTNEPTAPNTATMASAAQLPMIVSQDVLRQYALGQVVRGFRDVNAESLTWLPDQKPYVEARGSGAEAVLDKLFEGVLQYSLANVSDEIRGNVWLYDANDNILFYGRAQYFAATLGKDGPSYNIWMYPVPLLKNVSSAEILVLNNENQTVRRIQIRPDDNGAIRLEPYYTGVLNGILSVRFTDKSVALFNLSGKNNAGLATITETTDNWKIDGHYVIPSAPADKELVVDIIETWNKPSVFFKDVKASQVVKFDVKGLVRDEFGNVSVERPRAFLFEMINGLWSTGSGPLNGNEPTKTKLPLPGQYRVIFEWDQFGKPGRLYDGPGENLKG